MDERTVAKIVLWISTTIAVLSGIFTFVPNPYEKQSWGLCQLMFPIINTSICALRILNDRNTKFKLIEKINFVLLLLIGFRGLFLLLFSEDRGTVLLSYELYQFL